MRERICLQRACSSALRAARERIRGRCVEGSDGDRRIARHDDRANLADALQRSLEDGGASNLPPEEVARLWNEEIERRLARARERVARGEPTGRTADEVYADAEAKIQAMRA